MLMRYNKMDRSDIMITGDRRIAIYETLLEADLPMKGSTLAEMFKVSRQVIVQDIAVLRAEGKEIIATPAGYLVMQMEKNGLEKTIISKHNTLEALQKELEIIVDHGAKVLDVIVEHPIYGEIKGRLMLTNRIEVNAFIEKIKKEGATPLSKLTDGLHLHTLWVPDESTFNKIVESLKDFTR